MTATTIVIEYADFLNGFDWDFFCTFSTRYELTMKSARRVMERLHSHLTKHYGKVKLFFVAEPFDVKNGYHTHALVQFEQPIARSLKSILRQAWQIVSGGIGGKGNNHTILKKYDKDLGANYYVSKYMFKQNSDYDILI